MYYALLHNHICHMVPICPLKHANSINSHIATQATINGQEREVSSIFHAAIST